jgi:hypothetical protein
LVDMLRAMIGDGDADGLMDACAALANLANADETCQRSIAHAGAIRLLVRVRICLRDGASHE